jgi:pilus assembly protein CpaE
VDLRGGKALPSALGEVKRAHASTGVVIVATSPEPGLMLEAMRAGVNEFLSEPLKQAELEGAITRLTARRRPASTGEIFAFLGAKGGVGTTTTAVNVAVALARLNQGRVLLIDLHLAHGDAAIYLGVQPRFSVVDALDNTHRLDESFFRGLVTQTKSGPDLLASSDHALVSATGTERVRALIEFAAGHYRYIVIDVPRSDAAALDALDAAARLTIVANQELATVKGASRLAGALRQRYGKDRVHVIVSRFDKTADIGQEDVERVVGGKVKHLLPSDYRLTLSALNAGRPLAVDNHTRLAASFRALARDLAGAEPEAAKSAAPAGSIFGLFSPKRP